MLPRWSCRQNHPEEKGPAAARRSPEGHWLPRVPDTPPATHVKGHNLTACEPPIRSPDGWEEEGMGMRSHGQVVPGLELLRESILGAYEVTREAGGRGGAFQNMTVSDTGERTFEHWWEPSIVLRGGGAFLSRFQSSGGKALLRRLRGGGALHRNLGLLGLGNGWQHTSVCTGRQRAKVADQRIPRSKCCRDVNIVNRLLHKIWQGYQHSMRRRSASRQIHDIGVDFSVWAAALRTGQ